MGRVVLGVVAGVLVAGLVILLVESLGRVFYALPPGIDRADPEAMRRAIAALPRAAFVFVVGAWILGAAAGGWVAVRTAGRTAVWPGLVVGGLVLIGVAYNVTQLPHPAWAVVLAVAGVPLAAWLGARGARPRMAVGAGPARRAP